MIKLLILIAGVLIVGSFFGGYFFDFPFGSKNETSADNRNYDIDYSCGSDDDCYLTAPAKILECLPCDAFNCKIYDSGDKEVEAVSANWNPGCPPKDPDAVCAACLGGITGDYSAKCVSNRCEKVRE